ncbi:MAG: MerR family transcriptional regulator, partial [Deltaproteobacteria bacterium]
MVGKKKSEVRPLRADLPIYPIGVAAKLLEVHPRTLRIYEAEGLVRPDHQGARRLYSPNDIKWIFCLRSMIHDLGISIPGIKRLLNLAPCWEIAECPAEVYETCEAAVDRAMPRHLRQLGDEAAEKKRKPAACGKK